MHPYTKGLEFEDVLIYNFFKDSPANKEWRCIVDYHMKMAGAIWRAYDSPRHVIRNTLETLVS